MLLPLEFRKIFYVKVQGCQDIGGKLAIGVNVPKYVAVVTKLDLLGVLIE